MRIVIEIEGDRVISATVEGATSEDAPPREVLEAARARGGVSAGRAPWNPSGVAGTAAAVPQDAGATRSKGGAAAAKNAWNVQTSGSDRQANPTLTQ